MMAEYAPGPWHVDGLAIKDGEGQVVASVDELNERWRANARLIAAAPELLGALQAIAAHIGELPPVWSSSSGLQRLNQALAIIDKATK